MVMCSCCDCCIYAVGVGRARCWFHDWSHWCRQRMARLCWPRLTLMNTPSWPWTTRWDYRRAQTDEAIESECKKIADISRGSVATWLKSGEIFCDYFITDFPAGSQDGERIFKISHHLAEYEARVTSSNYSPWLRLSYSHICAERGR